MTVRYSKTILKHWSDRILTALLLSVCVILLVNPAQTQDATMTPTDWVYYWSSQVIYPEAVRFSLVVNRRAADLALATLTIQPEGRGAIDIPVSIVESAVFTDPYTAIVYFWEIPADSPLPLFSEVTYRWQIVTDRDEVARVQDQFEFVDTRADWLVDEDPAGLINLTVPVNTVDPPVLRTSVKDIYDLLAENLGQRPSFDLIVYPESLPVSPCVTNGEGRSVVISPEDQVEIACDPGTLESIFRASGLSLLKTPSAVFGDTDQDALAAFLFDRFYDPVWQGKDVPQWFRVGLNQFYLPASKAQLLSPARAAVRNDTVLSLEQIAVLPDLSAEMSKELWLAQSYGMIVYIADQIGVPGLDQLARDIGSAKSFEEAYQAATGQPLAALLPAWKNWLFRDAATSAYGFTPYQPETPVPTSTPTMTPLPPTATYTPTSTSTDTPTPTVTGFLSATPLPSRTPQPSPIPPTPSRTPRPPGSLIDTPTPSPTPEPPTSNPLTDGGIGFGILAALFLVLAVVSTIYLWILRRRGM